MHNMGMGGMAADALAGLILQFSWPMKASRAATALHWLFGADQH
jgi:hypothetical protein